MRLAVAVEARRDLRLALEELLAVHRARAGSHHDEAAQHLGMGEGEVARQVGAHGAAAEVHGAPAEVLEQAVEVAHEQVLRVGGGG